MTDRVGQTRAVNRSGTIELTPIRLVPVLIPDQPRTGTHRLATNCTIGASMSVRVIRFFTAHFRSSAGVANFSEADTLVIGREPSVPRQECR
jgi:hypothetical protein